MLLQPLSLRSAAFCGSVAPSALRGHTTVWPSAPRAASPNNNKVSLTREDIPRPGRSNQAKRGCHQTAIPTQTVLKVQLYALMRGQNINKADLARRLRVHRPQIDRLLNVRHTTNLDRIDESCAAIGHRGDVVVKRSNAG